MNSPWNSLWQAFLFGLIVTPVGDHVARRLGVLRRPEGESLSEPPRIPVIGGPVMLVVVTAVFAIQKWTGSIVIPTSSGPMSVRGMLASATVISLVGFLDDWIGLRGRWKLLGQIVAVSIAVAAGISINSIALFGWRLDFGPTQAIVTAAALLIAANSLNVLRGMDGLVSSYAMIVAGALGVIGCLSRNDAPAVISLALAGALLAFFLYSFPPASVFMGSSGTMTTGLLIGIAAVAGSAKSQAAAMLVVPAALLTLPLFDGAATVFRRSLARHGLFAPDQGQLYHRLLRIGFSRRRILAVVCLAALTTAVGAILSQFYKRELFAVVAACTIVAVLLVTRIFGNVRLSWQGNRRRFNQLLALKRGPVDPKWKSRLIDPIDWRQFWAAVVNTAQQLEFQHARMAIEESDESFRDTWDASATALMDCEIWRAEFALAPQGRRVGQLELVGPWGGEPAINRLGRLAELVPGFREVAELQSSGRDRRPHSIEESGTNRRSRIELVEAIAVDDVVHSYQAGVVGLRVCHLGKYYPPATGGIESHVRTLATAQAELGADVRVICVNHQNASGRDSTWNVWASTPTVEDCDSSVRVTRVGKIGTLARLDVCPRLVSTLRGLMRDPPHVVHMHSPNPTMLMAYALACPSLPLVVTHHSDVVRQRLLRLILAPFRRVVYTRAIQILTTSPNYAAGSPELSSYQSKVDDLPLGMELHPWLHPSDAAIEHARMLKRTIPGPLWLAVGRLTYYKGFDVALQALAHVPGTLMIIGMGPLDAELKQRATELGVADRVVWKTYAAPDELAGAYRAATALWFPSVARSEGFGLVQVEAMASGIPVLNTAIPHSGVTYVSPDGATGLTAPVNDPRAFAENARRLLDEPGLRERLGQEGQRRAIAEFDHRVMAQRSLEIYFRLLEQQSEANGIQQKLQPSSVRSGR